MIPKTLAAVLLSLGLAGAAQASPLAVFVDFEAGPFGFQPQGFTPNVMAGFPAPFLSISSNNGGGSDLLIQDFGSGQSDGNGLGVFSDADGNFLVLDFAVALGAINLSFGNDDACCSLAGDLAVLTVFNGGTQVGQVTVELNRNDLMDQTIFFSGGPFDRATFAYTNAAGSPFTGPGALGAGLTEVVDNLSYFGFAAPVPAPGALVLFGAGLLGLLAARRRRG